MKKTVNYGPYGKIEYYVFDPTGNITALSVTDVHPEDRPSAAAVIMAAEPSVEQVGFVRFNEGAGVPVELDMAGGEFCGNATMCSAALYLTMNDKAKKSARNSKGDYSVDVKVSGTSGPLTVNLKQTGENCFESSVAMPQAKGIEYLTLEMSWPGFSGSVCMPVVTLEGITHLIAEPGSDVFGLLEDKETAEKILKVWWDFLRPECLGMMFMDKGDKVRKLIPLVYVPGADTMFWENSCASGSAAAGMYLAARAGSPVDITFDEPAGRLRVESDPLAQRTILHGSVKLTCNY